MTICCDCSNTWLFFRILCSFEMQNRDNLSLFLVIVLLSLSNAQSAMTSEHLCFRSRSAGQGRTRLTFIREVTAGSRALYLSVWSQNKQLIKCEINYDPVVVEDYLDFCNKTAMLGREMMGFNVSTLLYPDSRCVLSSSGGLANGTRARKHGGGISPDGGDLSMDGGDLSVDGGDLSVDGGDLSVDGGVLSLGRATVKSRKKRSWLFPGTLWCGTGTKAIGYDQLGMFEHTDRCCREHDHCINIIPAFSVNYGVFNSNFFTVSHCDCDQRFRECLLGVNDTIANMVGYSFFNIIKVPCFELVQQRHCTKKYWWGMCKVAREAPYAVFRSASAYSTYAPGKHDHTGDSHNSTSTERPLTSPHGKTPKWKKPNTTVFSQRCTSRGPPRGDTFQRKGKKGKDCIINKKASTTTTANTTTTTTTTTTQKPTMSMRHNSISSTLVSAAPTLKTTNLKVGAQTAFRTTTLKINTTTLYIKKFGKKMSHRMEVSEYPSHSSPASAIGTMKSPEKTSSRTQSTPMTTLSAVPNERTTMHVLTTTTTSIHRKGQKKGRRCGPRLPARGDTFQPRRKHCLDQGTASPTPGIIRSPATTVVHNTSTIPGPRKTTVSPKELTWTTLRRKSPTMMSRKRNLATELNRTSELFVADGKSSKQTNNSVPLGKTHSAHRTTDHLLICGALKYLDECKHKIPPLEKKYDLQNMESRMVYHCNCTTRLAGQIQQFKKPNILSSLLMDFVSQFCLRPSNEKDCHHRKSCAASFSKASDLLQALQSMEEAHGARPQKPSKQTQRGFPVRMYKRCLKIARSESRS